MAERFRLSSEQWAQMRAHVLRCLPEEACGLLAGREGRVNWVRPITNLEHSPVRFRMDPAEQIQAMIELEREGLDLLAIYHSHPNGPQSPSATDSAEATYPSAAYLIWSPNKGVWICKAFRMAGANWLEIELILEGDQV